MNVSIQLSPLVFWTFLLAGAVPLAVAEDFDSLLNRAGDARKNGDLDRALLLLERARAIKSIPELDNNIGRILQDLGRFADASAAYRRVTASPRSREELRTLDAKRMIEPRPNTDRAL